MAAIVLSTAFALITAIVAWLIFGDKLRLDQDSTRNGLYNLAIYFAAAWPLAFAFVFLLLAR